MKRTAAEILREYGPFPGVEGVHGLTYDGRQVWFAAGDKLIALDPASGKTLRAIDVAARAGTAFDGEHLFQIAEDRIQKIDPNTGRVLATIPAPGGGGDTWEGDKGDLRRVDPRTGEVRERIEMPPGVAVSGLESDCGDQFFCGGGTSGKVRTVRRPGRGSAAGSGS